MKHCMKCGRNYDGYDGDMIDCPHCGEYGGNSYVYGSNGSQHAFSWGTSSADSSWSSSGDSSGEGCGILFGLVFLFSIISPLIGILEIVIRYVLTVLGGIILAGCLIIGAVFLWKRIADSSKKRSRSKESPVNEAGSGRTQQALIPSAKTEQTVRHAPSYLAPSYHVPYTITVTDSNYFRRG